MSEERALIDAARKGDHNAFGRLYDRYAPLIRAICFDLTGDAATCDDLAQDVFLRAFRGMSDLRQPESFAAWLIGIAKNRAKEWLRSRRREERVALSNPGMSGAPSGTQQEDFGDLQQAIRQLPERHRLAIRLFYIQDISAAEAHQIMNLSLSGFYAVLAEARAILRTRMARALNQEE